MSSAQILVVEDEKIVAMDLQNTLKSLDYAVPPPAATAGEALQRVATYHPDLVLMDVRLQGPIDGIAAAEQIWREFGIPVIYLTAHSDEHTLRLAKGTEPYGFIIKPYEKDDLRTAIEVALYKHKMEKKLKESEQWLSAILTNTGDAIVATDYKGIVAFINPAAEAMIHRKSPEACGNEWRDVFRIIDEKDGELPSAIIKVFREGVAAELPPSALLALKDSQRPIAGSVAPIRDDKDAITGYVFAFRDISQRRRLEEELRQANAILEKRVQERTETLALANRELKKEILDREAAEAKMRESETKFRSMADCAADAIFLFDKEGKILYSNRGAKTMFAYQDYEIGEKDIRSLFAPRAKSELDDLLARHRSPQTARPPERVSQLQGIDKQGREFPLELSLASWTSEKERYYVCILREITERLRAEAHLRFQANILSQVSDATIVTNNEEQIIYWNLAAERLYGFKMVDAIGKKLEEILEDFWDEPEKEKAVRSAVTGNGVWHGELTQRKKDEEALTVEASVGSLKNEAGETIGRLILVRDVRERKRLQGMLAHSDKLAAMGQMAAAVSHELKTPMSVIFGFADVILHGLKDDPTTKGHLETIKHQVIRCTDLINNLLNFSRKQRPKEECFQISDAMRQALALVEPYARTHGIRMETKLAEEPLRVQGTLDMMEQIVINLSTNAVDAMPKGGTLSIETSLRHKDGRAFAEIKVKDTGAGIPVDVREKIYEPFFSTKKGEGTGLGLWLVKELVSSLDGKIDCSSEVGKGTIFTLDLPATIQEKEKKEG